MKKTILTIILILISETLVFSQDIPYAVVNALNSPNPGYLFVGPYSITHQLFLDNSGFPAIMLEMSPNNLYFNVNLQNSGNGSDKWITYFDNQRGEFIALDKNFNEVKTFKCTGEVLTDWHDFKIGNNGNYLMIGTKIVLKDMSQVINGGQKEATIMVGVIQEFNKYGELVFEWNALDHLPITDLTEDMDLTEKSIRFPHFNSINWDYDGNILVSSRHLDEITKINRQTGQVIWRLGGSKSKGNQFTFANDTIDGFFGFSHQHDVSRLANGNILLFDNGNSRNEPYSRAVEYNIDETSKTAYKVWEYNHNKEIYAEVMGSVQRFEDGSTLIGWGGNSGGIITTEVDNNGNITYELQAQSYSSYIVKRYVFNFDFVKKDINTYGSYSFNDNNNFTGITLNLTSVNGTGKVWVERHKYMARNISFESLEPCTIYPVRWVISKRDISSLNGTIDFSLSALNNTYSANDLQVYYRQTEAMGQFKEVSITSKNSNSLRVNFEGFGEYIICNKALTIVTLESPPNNSIAVSNQTTLKWSRLNNNIKYDLLIAQDSGFNDIVLSKQGLLINYYDYSGFQSSRKYYWKVKAINSLCQSIWSEVWSFTTSISEPGLTSPTDNSRELDSAIFFQWQYVSGATKYQLQLSDTQYFLRVLKDLIISSSNQIFIKSLSYNTDYYWRVRAINEADTSKWSQIWSFTTRIAKANLISPPNDSLGLPIQIQLKWENIAGTYSYVLQLSKDENFTTIILDTNTINPQFLIKDLEYFTVYYWRVKAKSPKSLGQWSSIWTFMTNLASPVATTPLNNSTNIKLNDYLVWSQINGASYYHLQFSTDLSFNSKLVDDRNIYSNYYQYKNLISSTKYYWRVKAANLQMTSTWSDIYSFTTRDETHIYTPILVKPLNESINNDINLELDWEVSENAKNYQLQISNEIDFNNLILDTITPESKFELSNLDYNTEYHWRVLGINGNKTSEWSSIWKFTTALEQPTLRLPMNNEPAAEITGKLEWMPIDGSDKYHCQLSEKSDFAFPILDVLTINTEVSYADLKSNTVYIWRIQALSGNKESQWSDVWTFKTKEVLSVQDGNGILNKLSLMQIEPNPVQDISIIKLTITESTNLTIDIVNTLGVSYKLVPQKYLQAGEYAFELNIKHFPGGFNYCIVSSKDGIKTLKFTLVK